MARRWVRKLIPLLVGGVSLFAASTAAAHGEAVEGFPSWEERVLHAWVNRARIDPAAELAGCACSDKACYTAHPPLPYHPLLNRSARFHAAEMTLMGAAGTDSVCTLVAGIASSYPSTCNGQAACACVGGMPTCSSQCSTWQQRVQLFGITGSHEILGSGADPKSVVDTWFGESWTQGCSPTPIDRGTLLTVSGAIGFGVDSTSAVADMSATAPSLSYPVVSGSHFPRHSGLLTFVASWNDGWGASTAAVDIDGVCHPMTRERGTAYLGSWKGEVDVPAGGCRRYVFVYRNENSTLVRWPETGSFGIGDSACAAWNTDVPAVPSGCPCTPICDEKKCGDDQCGGSCGSCATSEVCQSGVCVAGDAGVDAPSDGPVQDVSVDAPDADQDSQPEAAQDASQEEAHDAAGDADAQSDASAGGSAGAGGAVIGDAAAGTAGKPVKPPVPPGKSIADAADDASCAIAHGGGRSRFAASLLCLALIALARRRRRSGPGAVALAIAAAGAVSMCGADGGQAHCEQEEQVASDGTHTKCAPYRCDADAGACLTSCASDEQCASNQLCRDTVCVAAASRPRVDLYDEDGCNCSMPGRQPGVPWTIAAALMAGALALLRRRKRVVVSVSAPIVFAFAVAVSLAGCSSQEEMPPGEVCEDAGYSISNRVMSCTGDEALAVHRWKVFRNEYQCLVKSVDARIEEYYTCPVDLRRTPCETVIAAGDQLDLWLGTVPICTEMLAHTSGARIPDVTGAGQ